MRKIIAAALFALWTTVSFAQAPPPVPALPDTSRISTYSISGTTCACAVNFQIYGDGTDVDNWIQVFIGSTQYLSTDPSFGWVLTSPTGSIGSIPRPITDAVLTFNSVQTGQVTIVGAQRPRRLSEFSENRGIPARDHNQVLNTLFAEERERWDAVNRAIRGQPGEVLNLLPPAATRQGSLLAFDGSGQPTITSPGAGTGNVIGPNPSTVNDLACFNSTTGSLLKDCGGVGTTKLNGTLVAQSALTDTTNATNISSGTLANGRLNTATTADWEANNSGKLLTTDQMWAAGAFATITFGATTTIDLSTLINGTVTLTANITTLNWNNCKAGQTGIIEFIQDGSGNHTVPAAWNSSFRWTGGNRGVLSTAINAVDWLFYQCKSATVAYVTLQKALAN